MDTLKLLEEEWRALGRREVELEQAIKSGVAEVRRLRTVGDNNAADKLATVIEKNQVELKRIVERVRTVEPKYFALVNRKLRERQR